jgi:hypothetical protein
MLDNQSASSTEPNRACERWSTGATPREKMSDNSGSVGIMGVLLGALIVVVVGGGLLFATGNLGNQSSTVKIELPKIGSK